MSQSAPVVFAAKVVACLLSVVAATSGQVSVPERDQLSYVQVKDALADPNWVIVDTRKTDEFNGWPLDGAKRGGHIPGTVDFAASWLDVDVENREQLLTSVLQTKGITSAKNVVLYSTKDSDRQRVTGFLKGQGFTNLHHFEFQKWLDHNGKLVRYPHYHRLLPPSVVKRLIDGEVPETFEDATKIKFVEVSWGDEAGSYAKGHIPGSFHVNTDHFEPPPKWYLGDSTVLTRFAKNYGFQKDDTVIISSDDVTASYRLYVVLRYMGVADVRVVNGGLAAWRRAGFAVETKSHPAPKPLPFGVSIPQHPELVIGTQQVKSKLQTPDQFALIDVRTWSEFLGQTSGYSYHKHKGRIPGSFYGQGDYRGKNSMLPYRNIDGTMRNADEIITMWEKAGIKMRQHLSFMCGGGWRAAEVFFIARVAGNKRTSLYSDGWIGWSNDRQNPIATGRPDTE